MTDPSPSLNTLSSHPSSKTPNHGNLTEPSLDVLREEIDRLDLALLDLLAERQRIVHAIGNYKRIRNLPPLDLERWQTMLKALRIKADERGLCPDFIDTLYEQIHHYSLTLESQPASAMEENP
jgi:chorismate mutase-like protein